MKKKYSDPLMFASRILTDPIPLTPSQNGEPGPDVGWEDSWEDNKRSVFSINSFTAAPASEEPVTVVNPVEEAATSFSTESAVEAVSTSTLEVAPIIDEIVPEVAEETATSGVTVY